MKQLLLLLTMGGWFLTSQVTAQPIPPATDANKAHYIFTVYTPKSLLEATLWQTPNVSLTTHRLINHTDSAEVRLRPVRQTALRTYVDLGADAGAMEVTNAQGSPTLHEVLCYDQLLSPEQRQLTESYLAIKHGLTLDQTLPTNYLAQNHAGSVFPVWTATEAPAFKQRIIGLARDTAAKLRRYRSASVLAPDLLSLEWPTPPTERAYLVVADDGEPTARVLPQGPTSGRQLLQRRWRMEITGVVPPTRLTFSSRKLFARAAAGERWVLQLTTSTGEVVLPGRAQDGDRVLFELPALPPGSAQFQLGLACDRCSVQEIVAIDDFFEVVRLSPNPVRAGQPVQLRAALQRPAGLTLLAYDALGREVIRQNLPATTHHLTEVILPAPGSYSLHLRSRLRHRNAPHYTLQVVVQ